MCAEVKSLAPNYEGLWESSFLIICFIATTLSESSPWHLTYFSNGHSDLYKCKKSGSVWD